MEDKRMERQRQGPLPLILFDFTVPGSTKHTHAFAFVSFIEPVPSQAHGSCLTADYTFRHVADAVRYDFCAANSFLQAKVSGHLRSSCRTNSNCRLLPFDDIYPKKKFIGFHHQHFSYRYCASKFTCRQVLLVVSI